MSTSLSRRRAAVAFAATLACSIVVPTQAGNGPQGRGKAVVTAANPYGAEAGAKMLEQGGNAIDAAVAIAYALNVVEPQSAGIGGGGFMMIHLADGHSHGRWDDDDHARGRGQRGRTFIIGTREKEPAAATPDMFVGVPNAPGGRASNLGNVGVLGPEDGNGLRLPAGFSSRIVARAGVRRSGDGTGYAWHDAPDGGAVFAQGDGGWVYVSNSEQDDGRGGVGALRFDRNANLVAQYPICNGTSRNCAGGPTPWGTWLSCEEVPTGRVWECTIDGSTAATVLPALGVFNHEAAAVDAANRHVYLTEDRPDSALLRFAASDNDWPPAASRGALQDGRLQLMVAEGAPLPPRDGDTLSRWRVRWVDWPAGAPRPAASRFDGGEGLWIHDGTVFFATKGDDRVWAFDTATSMLRVLYDDTTPGGASLTGVDNLLANAAGDVLVAEDGGRQQVVALTTDGKAVPLLQITGNSRTELTGPAFSPDGTRLYFSSQWGPGAQGRRGITYEVTGPFVLPG